ncbi:efflux RND transporter permease subunit [Limnoglobus roseus]|uniref:Transporter n=1 Tax=Limnoglobus roseus TaxID=2598579 RepID=A0A5C1ARL8_9BACT|nr:efflux RND transporter permease subunit [Limnoglobus roseus]QEL20352.1 transporter [Limnoglobus roseus]
MFSRFFVDRPIFAAVVSIVISLAGVLALLNLPVAQYPPITPPAVTISISYPGASAQVVADTVAAPIEQQVTGVPGMLYMSSNSGNDGSYSLTVTFEIGTDLNSAVVMVQNRVQLAMPQLPTAVQQQGITVRKRTPDMLMIISFSSPGGRYDNVYLSNYATVAIRDELLRQEGISDVTVFGQRDYSMRVWLDPQRLAAHDMTALDVATAVRAQNIEAALGRVGQPPGGKTRSFQFPLDTRGRLSEVEQFADIIVKAGGSRPLPSMMTSSGGGGSSTSTMRPMMPTMPMPTVGSMMNMNSSTSSSTSTSSTPSTGSTGQSTPNGSGSSGSSASGGSSSANPSNVMLLGSALGNPLAPGPATGGTALAGMGSSTNGMNAAGGSSSSTSSTNQGIPMVATTGGVVGANSLSGGSLDGGPNAATAVVRLSDVARIELGAATYDNGATFDGKPSVGLAVRLQPDANALDAGDRVRAKMEELRARFPEDITFDIAYDTTPFIRESINDVKWTLLEAVGLVAIVVLVFLQNWRAAIIPMIAVPVAILGTFAVMLALGFSVNNISLFGLVLAIGIVVDDAIVVVENVERWLEHGLSPKEAAYKAMEEVTGPVVAIAVVLCAVFVPCAFVGGIPGQFYRQFAVTITASTVFSAINSLTLSPALAAILMRKREHGRDWLTRGLDFLLGWFFWLFNKSFAAGTSAYAWTLARLLRVSLLVLIGYGGLLALTYWTFQKAPLGFVPEQDQGRLIVSIQLPDSSSLNRTQRVIHQAEVMALETPGVAHTTSAAGMSMVAQANSSNYGSIFVVLDPFDKRQAPDRKGAAIMAKLRKKFATITDADVKVFGAAPVPGLSVAGGFKIVVEDRGGLGLGELQKQTDAFVAKLQKEPTVNSVITQFRSRTPQLYLDVDRTKVESLGVDLNDVNQTMQIYLGSLYANSFNAFGRHWQVKLQAEGDFRNETKDISLLQVRNKWGEMVPLATLVRLRQINGPVSVNRYNLYTGAAVSGNVPLEVGSGDAIAAVDRVAKESLPRAMTTEWTELFYLQIRTGNTAIYVFLLAVVFVFLALAALYESWALPLAVILVVPLCLLCSVGGILLVGKSVDIFVQIGLIVLVGLACKNAILIVEFAELLHKEGKPRDVAAVEASRLRIRPILMTSLAFILGVVPLIVASGAGAEMRRSLGIAVFSGMLGVTLFGVFLTPVFFVLIQRGVDAKAFNAGVTRWGGFALIGALLGAIVGYLLAELGVGRMPLTVAIAVGTGAAVAVFAPLLRSVFRSGTNGGQSA